MKILLLALILASSGAHAADLKIRRTGPDRFVVPRALVDQTFDHLRDVLNQARAVPHLVHGKTEGYRLSQITPGSIFEKAGIRNGDVIRAFDGKVISDPATAAQCANQLRSAKSLRLQILRGGRKVTQIYELN